jgi:hypothetical protein
MVLKGILTTRRLYGFLFTAIIGTLLHFLYDWTGEIIFVAPFSAVNESVWEHMKLLFVPMFIFALIDYRKWGKNHDNFWCIKLLSITVGLLLIPTLYYTYTGALGITADWFNITIFFLAAGAAYYLEYRLETGPTACHTGSVRCAFLLLLIAAILTVTTFFPPRIPLFRDPLTGTYGIWSEP